VLVGASLTGVLTPVALLVLTVLLGVAQATNQATWSASVPDIVGPELMPSASMLASISVDLGRVAGPALGGLLIAASGAPRLSPASSTVSRYDRSCWFDRGESA